VLSLALVYFVLLQGAPAAVTRPGVVTGQLQAREGVPAATVRVSALPAPAASIRPSDGQNYFATTNPASTTLTDTQGRYRLTNLAPGRYFILASVLGYPTFYPSTTLADAATVVTVGAEAPVENVDFTILMPPGGRVSGRVNTVAAGTQERAVLSGLTLGELLESPVDASGNFSFGHVPKGRYFLSLFPTPPGMATHVFDVTETDVRLDLVRPMLRTVTGRVVAQNGPLPFGLLAFVTEQSYVDASISMDGTFTAQVQPGRHVVEMASMPPGYSIASVRLGTQDVSRGVEVSAGDVSGLVITVAPSARLPRLRGTIAGVPPVRLTSARLELTGRHITNALEAEIRPDGSFELLSVIPGTYRVRVPQVPEVTPSFIVVGLTDTDVQLGGGNR
jgi:hypothetical protein